MKNNIIQLDGMEALYSTYEYVGRFLGGNVSCRCVETLLDSKAEMFLVDT